MPKAQPRTNKQDEDALLQAALEADLENELNKNSESPPEVPVVDKVGLVELAEIGFWKKAKSIMFDKDKTLWNKVKDIGAHIWDTVKQFFTSDGLRSALGTIKMIASATLAAALFWMVGSWLIASFGLVTVAAGLAVVSVGAYSASKYMDYKEEAKTNPENAKMKFSIVESISPLVAA